MVLRVISATKSPTIQLLHELTLFYELLQELKVSILPPTQRENFHLEALHRHQEMEIYLLYHAQGIRHPMVNAWSNPTDNYRKFAKTVANMSACSQNQERDAQSEE
jgi:hypothetical protein